MVVAFCPVCYCCHIETSKKHDFECVRCLNEFDKEDAKLKEIDFVELAKFYDGVVEVRLIHEVQEKRYYQKKRR